MRRVAAAMSGELGLDEHGGGLRVAGQARIAGIGYEGDFGRPRLFNSFYTSNFHVCVAAQFRAQPGCQFA